MREPDGPEGETRQSAGRTVEERRTGERLVALLLAGGALLNFPLLAGLRGRGVVAGIPVLFVCLFLVWALLAGTTALILRDRPQRPGPEDDELGPREL